MTAEDRDRRGWDLVAAAQAGDHAAFGELWLRYRPQIQRFVASKLRDRDAVEDLTSETFLRAWRALGTARDQGREVGSWLVRIAHNLVVDHARATARSRAIFAEPTGSDDAPGVVFAPGPESGIPEQHNRAGTSVHLRSYLDQLPARERQCLRLRFMEELSAAEIGESMGCTASAAKTVQYRAVRRLAGLLEADGYTSSAEFAAASPDPTTVVPLTREPSESHQPALREVA
jgi:RNA polymerase sigma-70 factor (ECF subfamily)